MRDRIDRSADSHPSTIWPLLVVILVVLAGAGYMMFGHWRSGALLVGAATLLGAVLRAILPDELAGLLVVRRRWIDVLVLASTGIAIAVMAMQVPPGP